MSFSRLIYDKEAYDLELKRSTIPGDYRLFSLFAENTNQCFSYDGPIGSKVDVSSVKKQLIYFTCKWIFQKLKMGELL